MSSSPLPRRIAAAALATVATLASAAVAVGAATAARTTIEVSPRVLLTARDRSPVDFPGVAKARAGSPLPAGYIAVARKVRIARGGEVAFAAMRMACPRGKTWRTGASDGNIAISVLDRVVSRKRSVLVMASFDSRAVALGEVAAGTVYALCR